jgi:4-amino-4-deoxy-L-arabinose transferase-like glycosyltransferase
MLIAAKKHAWIVGAIFALGLIVRVLVFNCYLKHDVNYWQVDSLAYQSVAKSIAAGKGISTLTGAPNFHRLPGYSLYLAVFNKYFGPSPEPALWAQVALGALIPVLIFFLSLILFSGQLLLASAAGFYAAIHLGLVLYSGFLMTETLFILVFLAFLLFFFAHQDNPKRLAAAGVLLGIASLIRPVGHYVIVLALIILMLQRSHSMVKLRNSILMFLGWLIPVSMWLARNYLLLGHLFFHTLPGGHFLNLSASRVVMQTEGISYQQARRRVATEGHKEVRKEAKKLKKKRLSEIERCYVYERLARNHFMAHPLIALKFWLTDIFRTTFSLYSAELLYLDSGRKQVDYFAANRTFADMFKRYLMPQTDNKLLRVIIWLEIILCILLLFGCLRATWLMLWRGEYGLWVTIASFIALFLVISLAGGYARMRLPIEPFLIILGLYGYLAPCKKTASRKK